MRLRDERGMMAIGVALMLIVVLALFGGALWQYSMFELRRVEKAEQDMQALFLARSGAEAVMEVWRQASESDPSTRPFGQLDTLFYDHASNSFSLTKPENYLGAINVTVKHEEATESGDDVITVIESTATVGSTTRTVRLVTYPYLYGHHEDLAWYLEDSGEILIPKAGAREPVIIRPKKEDGFVHFTPSVLRTLRQSDRSSVTLIASDIIFERPFRFVGGKEDVVKGPEGSFALELEAERVFFSGLEVVFESEGVIRDPRNYGVIVRLPVIAGEKRGLLGKDIKATVKRGNVDDNARYGEVYFDIGDSEYVEYDWFLVFIYEADRESLFSGDEKAFYFKDSWYINPEEIHRKGARRFVEDAISAGEILPIRPEYLTNRQYLDGRRPFFWEQ
jgi:hypothetical protein